MSALAGIWNFDGKPDAERDCARMLAAQSIYGPHDSARWNAGSLAMGRNLFRTLPEDAFDTQPLVGGDGRFVLVADVRLDNRDELIGELQLARDRAAAMADSAILLATWEKWQELCLDRLCGNFALALFDRAESRLFLARDFAGARPLFHHRGKGFVAFASMPKGLHALPEIPRAPDEERAAEFLALLPEYGTRTFFRDVERVEPGTFVVVSPAGTTQRRYWQPQRRTIRLASADDYAEGLLHQLDRAVRSSLRGADNAVATHLSSGFDSSAVATSAALQLAPTGGKVVAFTSVPREGYEGSVRRGRFGDEGPIAAKTAAMHPNMEHVLIRTNGRSPLENLDRNFRLFDRPVLNLCNEVWAEAVLDAARDRKLGVLLSGLLGNMTISYDGLTHLTDLVRRGRWLTWLREGRGVVRNGHLRWRNVLTQSFGPYMPSFAWRALLAAYGKSALDMGSYSGIRPERLNELNIRAVARAHGLDIDYRPRKDGFETRLWVMRRVDLGNYNKGYLAGWGIDCRDPAADKRLLEFCLAVPEEQFLSQGRTKALGRRALAGRVAPDVIEMRGKGLQAVDWHEGLTAARGALREEVMRLVDCGPAATAIDIPRLSRLVENWPDGGWDHENVTAPYRLALLRSISTGHFLRKASGSNA